MNTEIELKFLVKFDDLVGETASKITELLIAKKYKFIEDKKELTNRYFDTNDLNLRCHDMGLRVRSNIDNLKHERIEQTIKTAGRVIGGLHQRPEFNVTIDNHTPDLSLFPNEIWHEQQNISDIQSNLLTIFSTNFTRLIWLITLEHEDKTNSVIELVFDQGLIIANNRQEQICEIELELIDGNISDLLTLAKTVCYCLKVRPGLKTKAARGYALWNSSTLSQNVEASQSLSALELVPLKQPQDLNQAFLTGVEFSLIQLQSRVDDYCGEPLLIFLNKITELLALLRHGFWMFDGFLSKEIKSIRNELSYFLKKLHWVENACHLQELTNKTGNYRKKLHFSENLITQLKLEKSRFPEVNEIVELFHSPRFNRLQLSLLNIVISKYQIDPKSQLLPADYAKFTTFVQSSLESSLSHLIHAMSVSISMNSKQYLQQHKLLIRSLLTGSWFGSLFNSSERLEFRNPWLDTKQGISELQTILLLQQQLLLTDKPSTKLSFWLESKVEHLLSVLNHSKNNAISMLPYWRK